MIARYALNVGKKNMAGGKIGAYRAVLVNSFQTI